MRRWAVLTAIVAVGVFVGSQAATGATTKTLSFDVSAFVPYATTTTHAASPPCEPGHPTFDQADGEFKGSLLQFEGGMLFPIQLTPGATVTKLRFVAVDQSDDADSFVYLLRKSLAKGISKDDGYKVMATTHTSGNVLEVTRQFIDNTITAPVADPNNFAYYLELVNCGITVEPIGVQVTMTS